MKILFLLFVLLIFSGCNVKVSQIEKEKILKTSIWERKDAIFSETGSVPHESKAFSPNGKYYAKEILPYGEGDIGIFDAENNILITVIKCSENKNDLKGLAWSPDSLLIAVMYHKDMCSEISIYEIKTGKPLRKITAGDYYHFMAFNKDTTELLLAKTRNDKPILINLRNISFVENSGFNLPWINYGWDVGRNPWGENHGGFSSNTDALNKKLEIIKESGGKIVRVFIFCDLRSGIIFNKKNEPERFDDFVFKDFEILIDTAKQKNLKILPVLFDYTLADGINEENGVKVGEYPEIFYEKEKRKKLLTAFKKFFQYFSKNKTIYAWDIINEPEHMVIEEEKIVEFVRDFTELIHSIDKNSKTTVGCTYLYNLLKFKDAEIDIFQAHYYDSFDNISPLTISKQEIPLEKAILIGEIEGTDIVEKLNLLWKNNYLGALFWLNKDFGEDEFYYYKVWTSVH